MAAAIYANEKRQREAAMRAFKADMKFRSNPIYAATGARNRVTYPSSKKAKVEIREPQKEATTYRDRRGEEHTFKPITKAAAAREIVAEAKANGIELTKAQAQQAAALTQEITKLAVADPTKFAEYLDKVADDAKGSGLMNMVGAPLVAFGGRVAHHAGVTVKDIGEVAARVAMHYLSTGQIVLPGINYDRLSLAGLRTMAEAAGEDSQLGRFMTAFTDTIYNKGPQAPKPKQAALPAYAGQGIGVDQSVGGISTERALVPAGGYDISMNGKTPALLGYRGNAKNYNVKSAKEMEAELRTQEESQYRPISWREVVGGVGDYLAKGRSEDYPNQYVEEEVD